MPSLRRIAVAFDPEPLDLRTHELLRGIARFAREARRWEWTLDPHALVRPAGTYDGVLTPTGSRLTRWHGRPAVPLVCLGWHCEARLTLTRVNENRFVAGIVAARHLLERGYQSFAYVGYFKDVRSRVERQTFRLELGRLGRPVGWCRTFLHYGPSAQWWDKTVAVLDDWLARLDVPAGLFVCSAPLARLVAQRVAARGLRIPHDVGLLVGDDDPVLCEVSPSLTALHFDYAEVGFRAAAALDALLDGAPPPPQAVLVLPTLVWRESTDRARVADPLVARAVRWIDERRTEGITAQAVAYALGVNWRTLEHRFRRRLGHTIHQEIILARLEHAKLLLAQGEGPLGSVAHQAGFPSEQALAQAFRRHLATTPGAWRREALLRRRGAPDAQAFPRRRRHKSPSGSALARAARERKPRPAATRRSER